MATQYSNDETALPIVNSPWPDVLTPTTACVEQDDPSSGGAAVQRVWPAGGRPTATSYNASSMAVGQLTSLRALTG